MLTDANLCDPNVHLELNEHILKLDDFLRAHSLQLDPDVDIVFEYDTGDDGETTCWYYFASHKHRAIFWLDSYQASDLMVWSEVKGVTCPSHLRECHNEKCSFTTSIRLGHEIEAQYW